MIVRELQPGEDHLWDSYVSTNEYSTPQQLAAWKTIFENVYKSKSHFLMVEEHGKVMGVLPLLQIKSLIAGNYVTSMPGGLLANDDDAANLLLERAKQIVETHHAKYLILRDGRRKWEFSDLLTDEEHLNLIVLIQPDLEEIKSSMKKRTRHLVNRSLDNGLNASHEWNLLDDFYPVYSLAMRQIGTPTLGRFFFENIASFIPQNIHLITISHQGEILGGGYIAPLKDSIHCLWSGLLRENYDLLISHFLYWEVIKFAHQHGYENVNLGRCRKDSGLFVFKEGFGGRVQPLYQQVYLNGINELPPVGAEMEDDLKYRVFTTAWRLMPHKITEILGPKIRKIMPFG